jgi:hypothetical protein
MNKTIKIFMRYIYYPFLYLFCLYYPKKVINIRFKRMFGRNMNWENPLSLCEKIIWLEYNSDTTIWSELSDKYRVREYIKKCGLEHILVKLYGVWENPEDINFNKLPNSFVLKSNNGGGGGYYYCGR